MSNHKLALIPSGYKGGTNPTVYSILPNNGDGDFDFDRASVGTRVRKDGLIEEVTNDVPRLDWLNSNCPSLLLEPERTNLLKYSEDYSQSEWSKIRSTISTNQSIAPNGTFTADKIIASTDNNTHRCDQVITLTNNAVYTLSFYVKEGGYNCIRASIGQSSLTFGSLASFNLNTETVSITGTVIDAQIQSIANNWYRCSITMDAGSIDRIVIGIGNNNSYSFAGDNSSGLFMWGAMIEQASYSSSYIKTEASTVTRLADECNGSGNADLFNDNEGVLYFEGSALANDGTIRWAVALSDGSNDERVQIIYLSDNSIASSVISSNSSQCSFNYSGGLATDFNKIAISYKDNDFKMYVNGTQVGSDTSGNAPSGLNTLGFERPTGVSQFYGKVKDVRYFDRALTDAELTELTT